jgi:cytoskeletal protein RodZ
MQRLKQKRIAGIIIVAALLLLGFWLWFSLYYSAEILLPPNHSITRPAKIKPPKVELTYQEMFQLAATEYKLEPRFLKALAYQ